MENDRTQYGASLLVAVGWFLTPVAAFAVGQWSLPDGPEATDMDCGSGGCGWSLMDFLPALVVVVGVPLLLILMAATAVVTRLRIPAALAGTLSALATVLFAAFGVALYSAAVR
ncbi:hypothetical protein OHA72_57980 [Dactylosporangium sp. NBC_01737]|uniref:hypothetical protein n=1 Tax=Dactylosporangium sp. NBC_01737 TaxID=2975959 RepID=UPI002E0F1F05|nr:hypothetical protein OHA72_57980 [Dactylosporangium sp. NBC_01737]